MSLFLIKKLDYDYMIRMQHTLTLTCKKGPKISTDAIKSHGY